MYESINLNLAVEDEDARVRFEAAVESLLAESGRTPRLVVALSGNTLPAETVAMLVGGLRRLREVGGAISVEAQTPAIRDAMALHGLDRVFALPLDPETASRTPRRRWVPRMAAAGLAVLALAAAMLPSKALGADAGGCARSARDPRTRDRTQIRIFRPIRDACTSTSA